jgi:hypothetical protein
MSLAANLSLAAERGNNIVPTQEAAASSSIANNLK